MSKVYTYLIDILIRYIKHETTITYENNKSKTKQQAHTLEQTLFFNELILSIYSIDIIFGKFKILKWVWHHFNATPHTWKD